ncbi:MAG: ATPase [Candidatus Hydrogenedentota bacterium]
MFRNPLKSNLYTELTDFFGTDPSTLAIDSIRFMAVDLPNVQAAMERICESERAAHRVLGISSVDLLNNSLGNLLVQKAPLGPVSYTNVRVAQEAFLRCAVNSVHFVEWPGAKVAVHVRKEDHAVDYALEIMAGTEELSREFMKRLWQSVDSENVYRGRIIALESDDYTAIDPENYTIAFRTIQMVRQEDIVLPDGVMEVIQRNTSGFFEHASALRRSGRSVKRGLLLHGAPGTGKSYTAKWVAQSVEGLTVILVAGNQLWMIKQICRLAAALSPSLVILEDVDLVASRRDGVRHPAYELTLHDLLNEVDGMAPDAEVLFLLTTNKPEVIEPAIASRPGRIDQAIEFPLPDSRCRKRLFDLYSYGLDVRLERLDEFVARTEGASPAFIQELFRKAAMFAAEDTAHSIGLLRVTDEHCELALRELLFGGGDLTRNLLGFRSSQLNLL